MRRRRSRNRGRVNWTPLLSLLLVGNVIAGIYKSPITAISKVKVEGAEEGDQKRIEAMLVRVHDQPALQVNRRLVETWLMDRSAVAKSELTRNIFGRATVTLEYRRPVASIAGLKGAALGRDGALFQTDQDLSNLPSLNIAKESIKPTLTLAGLWHSGEVAGLSSAVGDLASANPLRITVQEDGGLCLNIGSKFAVQLGLPDQLDDKIDFLRKQLDQDPELLVSGKTLNLVRLDRPVYRQGVANSLP